MSHQRAIGVLPDCCDQPPYAMNMLPIRWQYMLSICYPCPVDEPSTLTICLHHYQLAINLSICCQYVTTSSSHNAIEKHIIAMLSACAVKIITFMRIRSANANNEISSCYRDDPNMLWCHTLCDQHATNILSICYKCDIAMLSMFYQCAIREIPTHCLRAIAVPALRYDLHLLYEINILTICCQCAMQYMCYQHAIETKSKC